MRQAVRGWDVYNEMMSGNTVVRTEHKGEKTNIQVLPRDPTRFMKGSSFRLTLSSFFGSVSNKIVVCGPTWSPHQTSFCSSGARIRNTIEVQFDDPFATCPLSTHHPPELLCRLQATAVLLRAIAIGSTNVAIVIGRGTGTGMIVMAAVGGNGPGREAGSVLTRIRGTTVAYVVVYHHADGAMGPKEMAGGVRQHMSRASRPPRCLPAEAHMLSGVLAVLHATSNHHHSHQTHIWPSASALALLS